jgi:hypothetical protein
MFTGHTYYIVVDGYSGDCGFYTIDITEAEVPPLTGACCFEGGVCVPDQTEDDCTLEGGTYWGDGTGCDPNPCP